MIRVMWITGPHPDHSKGTPPIKSVKRPTASKDSMFVSRCIPHSQKIFKTNLLSSDNNVLSGSTHPLLPTDYPSHISCHPSYFFPCLFPVIYFCSINEFLHLRNFYNQYLTNYLLSLNSCLPLKPIIFCQSLLALYSL